MPIFHFQKFEKRKMHHGFYRQGNFSHSPEVSHLFGTQATGEELTVALTSDQHSPLDYQNSVNRDSFPRMSRSVYNSDFRFFQSIALDKHSHIS